jgi:hypothetical protein
MKKQTLFIAITLIIFSCKESKNRFYLPEYDVINSVIKAVVLSDSLDSKNQVIYDKLLCYDFGKEYPKVCWQRDSFDIDLPFSDDSRKSNNPFSFPNFISTGYLEFIIEKNLGVSIRPEDVKFLKYQIDSNLIINKNTPSIGSFSMMDYSSAKTLISDPTKGVYSLSVPLFNKDLDIAFLRTYYKWKAGGGGQWIILQKKSNKWILINNGDYLNY